MTEKQCCSQAKGLLLNSNAAAIFATYLNPTQCTSYDEVFVQSVCTLKLDNLRHETCSKNKSAKPGFTMRKLVYPWMKVSFLIAYKNYPVSRPILGCETETTMVQDQDRCKIAETKTETTTTRSQDRFRDRNRS